MSRPTESQAASEEQSWSAYFKEEVTADWGDLVLIVGCLATGLLDSAIFNVWSCFVSMQTGNTVYVGLGVSGQPYSQPTRYIKSGASIVAFVLGSFIFSRLMRAMKPLRRSTVIITTFLQSTLIIISASLTTFGVVSQNAGNELPGNLIVLLPITLLAMQAGGQCVLSRVLGYNELPTVVLTSAYCDFAMDEKLFSGISENSKRNRRIGSVLMLVLGAVIGGFLTQEGDIAIALWAVAGIKIGMAFVWLFWKPKEGIVRLP